MAQYEANSIVRGAIFLAFSSCQRPSTTFGIPNEGEADDEIAEAVSKFGNLSWIDLDPSVWFDYDWGLPLLPPELFVYYLPSLMIAAMQSPVMTSRPVHEIIEILSRLDVVDPSPWESKRFLILSDFQLMCISSWVMWVGEAGIIGDDLVTDCIGVISDVFEVRWNERGSRQ